jgi:shikimate kinase
MLLERIYLIGYMGSGKTTVGKKLSRRLGFRFLDLDEYIEKKYHTSVSVLFSKYDEKAFRKIEFQALRETADLKHVVISTGGGTPCFHNNMDFIKKNGISVYLKMSPEALASRLQKARRQRPLLRNHQNDLAAFIEASLRERVVYYEQADIIEPALDVNIKVLSEKLLALV